MRVHVKGAGMKDVNGKYNATNDKSRFPTIQFQTGSYTPEFLYHHVSNTTKHEFGMFLTVMPAYGFVKEKVWIIARTDWKKPIFYYYAKPTKGNIPPENGWTEVAGIDPCPTISTELLSSPKQKVEALPRALLYPWKN